MKAVVYVNHPRGTADSGDCNPMVIGYMEALDKLTVTMNIKCFIIRNVGS